MLSKPVTFIARHAILGHRNRLAMKPFIAIVHKDPESAYGLSFPDAPGCFSAAGEIDDVFANAAEALELWAEGVVEHGLALPEPRDLSALRADPEWEASFATAAMVIAVELPLKVLKAA